ncbi:MAG: hypothetical protein V1847_04175 [Candidatus Diapherotrites archaeon]
MEKKSGISGFFKSVFGPSKESIVEVPAEKSLEEISEWLSAREKEERKKVVEKMLSKLSQVRELLRRIGSAMGEVEKSDVSATSEKHDVRLRKIVGTSKDVFVNRMRAVIEKLEPPQSKEYSALQKYARESGFVLEREVNATWKNIAYTGILVENELKQVGGPLQELSKELKEFHQNFFQNQSLSSIENARQKATALLENRLELEEGKKELDSLEGKLSEQTKKVESLEEKLKALQNSEEIQSISTLKEQKSKLLTEKRELKARAVNVFTPLEKPLRKFQKMAEEEQVPLAKPDFQLLTSFNSDPFLALEHDSNFERLQKMTSQMLSLVEQGKIEFKDEKEKQKKLEAIKEAVHFDFSSNIFSKLGLIDAEIRKIDEKLSSQDALKTVQRSESELAEKKREIETVRAELNSAQRRIEELEITIQSRQNELKTVLSSLDPKITLKI